MTGSAETRAITERTVLLRPRTDADLLGLLAILAACAEDSGYFADDSGRLVPHALESLADPRFRASWVAEDQHGLLGQISIMPLPASEDLAYLPFWLAATGAPIERHCLIKRLFVDPQQQGRGVARSLMSAAMAEISANGMIGVLDTASVAESAMALYRRSGWREVARCKPTWSDGAFDAVLFVQPGS
ncbi:MAG: GNAT family N-acetyltransferase [Renibacterium salmoninarum]|nr:GNAT family N-acetyltransferase [Renibacterium salmoninarum]